MPVALVTGASRGLGREIARALHKGGYAIAANYFSSETETSELMRNLGENSLAVRADVGDLEQVREMARLIEKAFGRIDVIINNAGITRDNLLLRQTEAEWDEVVRTNLTGSFHVIRTMAPIMIKSGGGHIINVASFSGVRGKEGQAAYSASKAALLGLTRTAALELAPYDIRVNAILPGYMLTGMGIKAEKAMEAAKKESLLKKLSDPAEVAEFIAFLVDSKNITGQVFSLDSRMI